MILIISFIMLRAAMDRQTVDDDTRPVQADSSSEPQDVRCCCGSLLAKLVDGGVELKCRRCKRIVVVPFDAEDAGDDISIGNERPPRSRG